MGAYNFYYNYRIARNNFLESTEVEDSNLGITSTYKNHKIYRFRELSAYPLQNMCRLKSIGVLLNDDVRPVVSTGITIAPNIILTAAHNIKSHLFKSELNPDVIQAQHGGIINQADVLKMQDYILHENWYNSVTGYNSNFDLALIKTNKPMRSNSTVLQNWDTRPSNPIYLFICGYPKTDHEYLNYGRGRWLNTNGTIIAHDIDTKPGMSGGPLCLQTNGNVYICGIHIGGFESPAGGFGDGLNKAVVFTSEILGWIKENMKKL